MDSLEAPTLRKLFPPEAFDALPVLLPLDVTAPRQASKLPFDLGWVSVQELNLSYHIMDI